MARLPTWEAGSVDSLAIHTATRRYLMNRFAELTSRYAELPGQGRAADGYHYTDEALALFPRYNVVEAIRVEVERFDPDDLPDADELLAQLHLAATEAESVMTKPRLGPVEEEAMRAERALVGAFLDDPRKIEELGSEPLPYRRVLSSAESRNLESRLAERWGVRQKMWHPMIDKDVPDGVLVLADDLPPSDAIVAPLRSLLAEMGRRRAYELREYGADYELDVSMLEPFYNGAEGLWTDADCDWLIYASHESTTAFGGAVAEGLLRQLPSLARRRWRL